MVHIGAAGFLTFVLGVADIVFFCAGKTHHD